MPAPDFSAFFQTTTGGKTPYAYQCRLACGPEAHPEKPETLDRKTHCASRLIDIPTGLGKTAAVVLAWLWNRLGPGGRGAVPAEEPKWPRRLVYCLPMRTLVEQTVSEAKEWIAELVKADFIEGEPPKVHILMGGEGAGDWDIHPEKPVILIGTQDMLLSRALNRGYGMSRYRWPMHFGLLNNDALWVMDETQLMGPGLSTSCQLEAFRNPSAQGFDSFSAAGSVTWYMSATSNPGHLLTRDWRNVERPKEFQFGLSSEEKSATSSPIHQRRTASKRLELKPDSNFGDTTATELLVGSIRSRHQEMLAAIGDDTSLPGRTLIICNTVDRAVAVYRLLAAQELEGCDLLLLHSRFRPPERKEQMKRLGSIDRTVFPNGQIVVATQVVEAGVDVSAVRLWSEVAPWPSLVQRLGRLNPDGRERLRPRSPSARGAAGNGLRGGFLFQRSRATARIILQWGRSPQPTASQRYRTIYVNTDYRPHNEWLSLRRSPSAPKGGRCATRQPTLRQRRKRMSGGSKTHTQR